MVDEKSSLTKTIGKSKQIFRKVKYGAIEDTNETKQKYRKLRSVIYIYYVCNNYYNIKLFVLNVFVAFIRDALVSSA